MTDLAIVRTGLVCPVGIRTDAALAAIRAGVTRFQLLDEGLRIARLSLIDPASTRFDRMLALVRRALSEVLAEPLMPRPAELPVFLALPEPDSGAAFDETALVGTVRSLVSAATGAQVVPGGNAIHRSGRAGVFAALRQASVSLSDDRFHWALVGAVDSLVDPASVEHLAAHGLLLSAQNLDGRIPGEAGVFFLVTRPGVVDRRHIRVNVSTTIIDAEPACFADFMAGKALNRAAGLTRLIRGIGRALPGRFDAVVSAQPGEAFWGREFSYAYLRNVASMPEPLQLVACGVELGDAGSAAGGVALTRGMAELRPPSWSRSRQRRGVLVYGASDRGALGGCALLPA